MVTDLSTSELIIGSIISPSMEGHTAREMYEQTKPEFFSSVPQALECYNIIKELYEANSDITVLTCAMLAKKRHLPSAASAFVAYSNSISVTTKYEYLIHACQQEYLSKETVRHSSVASKLLLQGDEPDKVVNYLISTLSSLAENLNPKSKSLTLAEAIKLETQDFDRRYVNQRDNIPSGVPIGIQPFDDTFNGWQNGDLVVVAARPGMGKTAFMLACAKNAALKKKNVVIANIEMTVIKLAQRLIISELEDIDPKQIKNATLTDDQIKRYIHQANQLADLPIEIIDDSSLSLEDLCAQIRRKHRKGLVDILFIDYLQLLLTITKHERRDLEIGHITKTLKALAKELNIPIILLAQVSRTVDSSKHKVPTLADLRESGSIEQDADIVIFIVRPSVYQLNDDNGQPIPESICNFHVTKYRDGSVCRIDTETNKSVSKFYKVGTMPSYFTPSNPDLHIETNKSITQNTNFDNFEDEYLPF